MAELEANFILNNEPNIEALFEIYASSTTWGNILGDIENQTDLKNALNDLAGGIDSNHQAIGEINTTISGYGNIVTYNASDFATFAQGALAETALQPNDNISELNNNVGYITGITSSDVITALGYTPYNSSNPNGYTSNIGTVTSVNNISPDSGGNITLTIPDALPSQAGNSGKFLTTDGTDASWATITMPTVDQTYDGTSANAQSGVAIAGAGFLTSASLTNYVTTNTAQTISASKAFSQPLVIADNNGLASGTILSNKKILQRSSGDNTLTLNNKDNKLRLVGSETRPKYSSDGTNFTDIALYSDFTAIDDLIPSQASSSNQLADKAFVNSSIATNTANFIGTFSDVATLEAYSGTVTNNDYAFVINSVVTDNGNDWSDFATLDAYNKTLLTNFDYAWVVNGSNFDLYRFDIVNQNWDLRASNIAKASVTLNTAYNRYKATVSGNTVTWEYEYTLNNSSFTATQWAAINSGITSTDVALIGTALQAGDNVSSLLNDAGYITGITSSDVTTALGYTPLQSSDLTGYLQNTATGTTSMTIGGTATGNSYSINIGKNSSIGSNNCVAVGYSAQATGNYALSFGYYAKATAQNAIQLGYGTNSTADSLKVQSYELLNTSTGLIPDARISSNIARTSAIPTDTSELTNGAGYISGITSGDVTTALGYTPYNSTNPSGFISSAAISSLTDVTLSSLANGQGLIYNSTSQKWENGAISSSTSWGSITGTLSNQTDLQNALNGKSKVTIVDWTV